MKADGVAWRRRTLSAFRLARIKAIRNGIVVAASSYPERNAKSGRPFGRKQGKEGIVGRGKAARHGKRSADGPEACGSAGRPVTLPKAGMSAAWSKCPRFQSEAQHQAVSAAERVAETA